MEGLDTFVAGIRPRLRDAELDPEIGYVRSGGVTCATRWLSGNVANVSLGYEFDLISAGDGVGYVLMSWSPLSDFAGLKEQLDKTASALELPGPDSEWSRRSTPTDHSFAFRDWTFELRFRDSVFAATDSKPGERYSFIASGGDVALHIFLTEARRRGRRGARHHRACGRRRRSPRRALALRSRSRRRIGTTALDAQRRATADRPGHRRHRPGRRPLGRPADGVTGSDRPSQDAVGGAAPILTGRPARGGRRLSGGLRARARGARISRTVGTADAGGEPGPRSPRLGGPGRARRGRAPGSRPQGAGAPFAGRLRGGVDRGPLREQPGHPGAGRAVERSGLHRRRGRHSLGGRRRRAAAGGLRGGRGGGGGRRAADRTQWPAGGGPRVRRTAGGRPRGDPRPRRRRHRAPGGRAAGRGRHRPGASAQRRDPRRHQAPRRARRRRRRPHATATPDPRRLRS